MKKNVLKKFAAAALAAATVMSSMSVMAFADDTGATANTGSVTITKYEGTSQGYEGVETNYGAEQSSVPGEKLNNVEFAYIAVGDRVQVDVTDANTGKMTTEMLYTLSNEAVKELGLKDSDKIIENNNTYYRMSTLNEAIQNKKDDVIALVKDKTKDHTGANTEETGKGKTSGDGIIKFDKLSLEKLYLFAETNASGATKVSDNSSVAVTKVSVPFFVSLPFKDEKGNSVKDIYAYPKNSTGTATIDKKIVKNGTDKATTTANIGDTINYKVTYSIPVGENGLESLVVTDTMSKGLTFVNNPDNIKVLNGNEEVDRTMYTVKDSKDDSTKVTTITITFNSDKYCKTLDQNTTQNFTITYTATLNKDAVLGQSGNTNDVFVTYRNTGDVDRDTEHKSTTKVFTYGIDLLKKGEGVDKLVGVKFTLTDENGKRVNVEKNDSNNFYTPGGNSNTVTTGDDGKIYIRGLKPGTYKLTETKTNAGYVLLKDPVVIVIKEDNAIGGAEATVGSKPVTMQNDQKNSGSDTAEVPLTVVNSKGFDLPATGGRGIALFTIAGIAIVAAAGSLLFMRKRSK
jgi:fimbrial isopeptide formation D2 family protein/LPXTG-motif cell wall-anchored protein